MPSAISTLEMFLPVFQASFIQQQLALTTTCFTLSTADGPASCSLGKMNYSKGELPPPPPPMSINASIFELTLISFSPPQKKKH